MLGKYTLDVYVNGMPLQNVIWKLHEFSIFSNVNVAGLRGGRDPTTVVSGQSTDLQPHPPFGQEETQVAAGMSPTFEHIAD